MTKSGSAHKFTWGEHISIGSIGNRTEDAINAKLGNGELKVTYAKKTITTVKATCTFRQNSPPFQTQTSELSICSHKHNKCWEEPVQLPQPVSQSQQWPTSLEFERKLRISRKKPSNRNHTNTRPQGYQREHQHDKGGKIPTNFLTHLTFRILKHNNDP